MKLPDALRRAIRTFVQAFTGVIILQAGAIALNVNEGTWVPDVDWLKRVGISASAAGVIAVLTWLHNATEDAGVVPSILKAKASSGAHPITHDPVK